MEQLITSAYEHKLACVFHKIDNRGLLIDTSKLAKLRKYCNERIIELCDDISRSIGTVVYVGKENKPPLGSSTVNINYSPSLQDLLKNIGFSLPKIKRKNKDTQEYEMADSANDLVLHKTMADPSLWPSRLGLDPAKLLKNLIEIRGIAKLKGTYINARLFNDTYYCNYSVSATVTGRRGSKKHIFNLGNNAQNFPKHSELGLKFRECIIARPNKLFFIVDQVSAEDWPVQALAENYTALEDMRNGVNRHYKFASIIFGVDEATLRAGRDRKDSTSDMQYYLGKKSRHANNYGMRAARMSEQLAAEGFSFAKDFCQTMLDKVNNADPNVDKVFHEYIKRLLFNSSDKLIRTPLGRERQFLGLRPSSPNYELLNEAYSYVPQSTVGDNTGLAVLEISNYNNYIVNDGHDSISQEVPDDEKELLSVSETTRKAFDRTITFDNGISINIPIEGELGYDLSNTVKIKHFTPDGVLDAYKKLKQQREAQIATDSKEALAAILS